MHADGMTSRRGVTCLRQQVSMVWEEARLVRTVGTDTETTATATRGD